MEMLDRSLHVLGIVVDTPSFNEHALALGDDSVEVWSQPVCKDQAHQLCSVVHDTDQTVIRDWLGLSFLWNGSNVH
jgi:hypothetical protein